MDSRIIKNNRVEEYSHPDYFPVTIFETTLDPASNELTSLHYHGDIQFTYVTEGPLLIEINKEKIFLKSGQGIFINTGFLHAIYPQGSNVCAYITFNISPHFFAVAGSTVHKKHIAAFFSKDSIAYTKFTKNKPWQKIILSTLREMYSIERQRPFAYEIDMASKIFTISYELISHIATQLHQMPLKVSSREVRMDNMLTYIQQNFKSKISLDDLCQVGMISRAECCRLFKNTLNLSPFTYINLHRLNQSMVLLLNTDLPITEICQSVGFGSSSYYISKFKAETGVTPSQFRTQSK